MDVDQHQWLIDTMRCNLTGDNSPPLKDLFSFDDITPSQLELPENLIKKIL